MAYETILAEKRGEVGLITLNRPKAMNALNAELAQELLDAVQKFDGDNNIGAIVITGSEKAFAAGVDIKEMQSLEYVDVLMNDFISVWDRFAASRKPVIAAVAGYALGGGCELAMMCDFIIAGESAKFGQPEITLGVMPGIGGTQRLARAIGKAKTMEMCLTGRHMTAAEAESSGLVARVVPDHDVVEEAMSVAERIATFSRPSVIMTKDAVNRAFETTLAEGLRYERSVFYSMFALEDQKEGMAAFAEKRSPNFKNR
ncbi:enoyl-CoA hydratase [Oricola cellulosilytica]|uniref:enoyl-CoA hydratase n=1 Tax=Oricola cellulosilytica TaxID=1429082 RepID=A0A4R0PEX0_9HYPH|nr:enoyl-CoA hydratase [Oricola cellulosilytica]TCD16366.1 enoyl-CoA hydratase [Oricola cellulosilytica]